MDIHTLIAGINAVGAKYTQTADHASIKEYEGQALVPIANALTDIADRLLAGAGKKQLLVTVPLLTEAASILDSTARMLLIARLSVTNRHLREQLAHIDAETLKVFNQITDWQQSFPTAATWIRTTSH